MTRTSARNKQCGDRQRLSAKTTLYDSMRRPGRKWHAADTMDCGTSVRRRAGHAGQAIWGGEPDGHVPAAALEEAATWPARRLGHHEASETLSWTQNAQYGSVSMHVGPLL